MEVKTADNEFQHVIYNDSQYSKLKDHLKQTAEQPQHHLSLFLGLYQPNKKKAVRDIAKNINREVKTIDTENYVSKIESDTFKKLDALFDNFDQTDVILYFKNGGKLCGSYTGNSQSRVKDATPQERYCLEKRQETTGRAIVETR